MAPWALAAIGAACSVQSARILAVHKDLPAFIQALGVLGLALSAFLLIRMLYKRFSGDRTWGAPPYTATQAHLIFWNSLVVAVVGAAMWIWRGS
jgi:hypothetical protein